MPSLGMAVVTTLRFFPVLKRRPARDYHHSHHNNFNNRDEGERFSHRRLLADKKKRPVVLCGIHALFTFLYVHQHMEKVMPHFLREASMHTRLGRWCHVTAPLYRNTCDWERKVDLANSDNGNSGSTVERDNRDDNKEVSKEYNNEDNEDGLRNKFLYGYWYVH
jgi:hypothetical protein